MKILSKLHDLIHYVLSIPVITFISRKQKEQEDKIQHLLCKLEKAYKQLQMYKVFWDCSSSGLVLVRLSDGQILDLNPAMCAMYGYTHEEALNITIFEVATDKEQMRISLDEKVTNIRHRWHKKKNGERICISAVLTYLNDRGYDVVAASIKESPVLDVEGT